MKTQTVSLIAVGVVVLIIVIVLLVRCVREKFSSPNGGSLFLYPETGGFNVKDFGGFPDPAVVKKNFSSITVIANRSVKNFTDQWNDPKVLKLSQDSGLPIVKWLVYYFGNDGPLCMCNEAMCKCPPPPKKCTITPGIPNPTTCDGVKDMIIKEVGTYGVKGILYDDETGNPDAIIACLEGVAAAVPGLQLGWSSSVGTAKQTSPKSKGSRVWDIVLGQAYTDCSVQLYNSKSCGGTASDFWAQIAKLLGQGLPNEAPAGRGVPMVCGSGNCIDPLDCTNNTKGLCGREDVWRSDRCCDSGPTCRLQMEELRHLVRDILSRR